MVKISLKRKILYTLAGLIIVFGTVMVIAVFTYSKSALIAQKKVDFGLNVVRQAEETGQVFIGAEELIRTMAKQGPIIEYLEDNKRQFQREDIVELMRGYDIGGYYTSIYLMDVYGMIYATTDEIFLGQDLSYRKYFKEAILDQMSVALYTGYYSKKIGFYFALPVKNDEGIVGVIAFKLVPEKIASTLGFDALSGGESNVMLVDEDGIVILSNKEEFQYKSLGKLSEEKKSEIIGDHRLDGVVASIENLNYDRVQQVLGTMSGPQVFEYAEPKNNNIRIAGAAQVLNYPFYVVIDEGAIDFNRSALNIGLSIAVIIFFGSLIMLMAVYLLVKSFLRPIPEIMSYAELLGRGKFSEKIEIATGDELDGLIEIMNKMADQLNAYYQLLQSEIRIKTGDVKRKINEIEIKNSEIAEIRSRLHKLLKERGEKQ